MIPTPRTGSVLGNAGAATTNPSAATISAEHARIMCVIGLLHGCSAETQLVPSLVSISRVHNDVARSARKDIPTCSARNAISAEVDCDLLVTLVEIIVDAAGGPKVRAASKLTKEFGDGRELGGWPLLLHSQDCAAALLFRTGPVEQVDWANPIADCSGYSDRISPA